MDRPQDRFFRPPDTSGASIPSSRTQGGRSKVRRAKALLFWDDGLSPLDAAQVLHLDEDTIRGRKRGFGSDESVVFAAAVHPAHRSRPAHGRFPKGEKVAIKATSGRKRRNVHGVLRSASEPDRAIAGHHA